MWGLRLKSLISIKQKPDFNQVELISECDSRGGGMKQM